MTFVNEHECKRILRSLAISSASDWKHWSRNNSLRRRRLNIPSSPEESYQNKNFWREYSGGYPSQWKEFHIWIKDSGIRMENREMSLWARYADRFRAASAYRGMKFTGLEEKTERGYSAALRIFLSYSCLEAAWVACGVSNSTRFGCIDIVLAENIRTSLRFSDNITGRSNNERLNKAIDKFMSGKSDDVLIVARSIRHCVAHGLYTPWGSHAVSLRATRTLNDLAECILSYSEKFFREHLRCRRMAQREA